MADRDGDERFPKGARLRKKREFDLVFKEGRRVRLPGLTILFRPNPGGIARLGVSVSKRRLPKAVQRNRARRVARELFRRNRALFPPGFDYVFLIGPEFLAHPYGHHLRRLQKVMKGERRPAHGG